VPPRHATPRHGAMAGSGATPTRTIERPTCRLFNRVGSARRTLEKAGTVQTAGVGSGIPSMDRCYPLPGGRPASTPHAPSASFDSLAAALRREEGRGESLRSDRCIGLMKLQGRAQEMGVTPARVHATPPTSLASWKPLRELPNGSHSNRLGHTTKPTSTRAWV
jgi:hypothetical protein